MNPNTMVKCTKAGVLFVTVCTVLVSPYEVDAQNRQERLIVDAIGSDTAVTVATEHMSVSERAAKNVSSDVAIPGPGMLDVDPLSTQGEWAVNYETTDLEMCRAATATAIAAVIEKYSSGDWVISTSCLNSMVEVELDLDEGTASGEQWKGPDGYLWQNSLRF